MYARGRACVCVFACVCVCLCVPVCVHGSARMQWMLTVILCHLLVDVVFTGCCFCCFLFLLDKATCAKENLPFLILLLNGQKSFWIELNINIVRYTKKKTTMSIKMIMMIFRVGIFLWFFFKVRWGEGKFPSALVRAYTLTRAKWQSNQWASLWRHDCGHFVNEEDEEQWQD